ncbi:MAG: ATP-binding protein [Nocardioides sp.]
MRRLPLRVRLVAGFLAAMAVLLTAAGAFVYWRVQYALDRDIDGDLTRATTTISPLVDSSGQVTSSVAADATGAGWQVLDDSGAVLDSGLSAPVDALVTAAELAAVGGGTQTSDIGNLLPVSPDPYRVQVSAVDDGRLLLLVAVRRDHRDEALRELLLQLTLAGAGALALAALVGDVLARAALRPVERYRRRAEEIAGGANTLRLDVPADRDDEVTRLGHTLNQMLATLERSLDRERRFVNDASHEMRTPITLLTSRIQLARRRSRTTQEHETVLDELAIDVTRLADLTEHLLTLGSPSDATAHQADTNRVVAAVIERRRLARPDEAHQLVLELAPASSVAAIDPVALERIMNNVVENAFLHGQPPVRVRVTHAADAWILIEVEDAGPGMPPELLADAAERFTRSAEARGLPGAGLGLALAAQIVTAAGGEARLCFAGTHTGHGHRVAQPCGHGTKMTVSVFVPGAGTEMPER